MFLAGLLVLLHHDLTVHSPLPGKGLVHFPVRKRVRCRTRDLHQSLLVKLNHAQQMAHALPAPPPAPEVTPEVISAIKISFAPQAVVEVDIFNGMTRCFHHLPTILYFWGT